MKKFQLKKGEEGAIHFELHRKEFDSKTGKQLFKPQSFICISRDIEAFLKHPNGMSIVKINHIPEGFKFPLRKVKLDDGKTTKMVPYEVMIGVEVPSFSGGGNSESSRRTELKQYTVQQIDEILESLYLPVEGNKGAKIQSILDDEFPKD